MKSKPDSRAGEFRAKRFALLFHDPGHKVELRTLGRREYQLASHRFTQQPERLPEQSNLSTKFCGWMFTLAAEMIVPLSRGPRLPTTRARAKFGEQMFYQPRNNPISTLRRTPYYICSGVSYRDVEDDDPPACPVIAVRHGHDKLVVDFR